MVSPYFLVAIGGLTISLLCLRIIENQDQSKRFPPILLLIATVITIITVIVSAISTWIALTHFWSTMGLPSSFLILPGTILVFVGGILLMFASKYISFELALTGSFSIVMGVLIFLFGIIRAIAPYLPPGW